MAKLNFGCGKTIKKGWVNVDIQKGKEIDESFDFNKFPYPFKDNFFDYVLVDNVFEHLENPGHVLDELHRICKCKGIIRIIVPYYNCAGAYNDLSHKHYFNATSFDNLVSPHNYYIGKKEEKFRIKNLKLIPTRFGKMIYPPKVRYLASLVLGEVISEIDVELEVIK